MDATSTISVESRPRLPIAIAIVGALIVAGSFAIAWAMSITRPEFATAAWIVSACEAIIGVLLVTRRLQQRAHEAITIDDSGVRLTTPEGLQTLRWESIARVAVRWRDALELSTAGGSIAIRISRRFDKFPQLIAFTLPRLAGARARRARAVTPDTSERFGLSIRSQIGVLLLSIAFTAATGWANLWLWAIGFLALPVAMWRLGGCAYAISVGSVVRFDSLLRTIEIPARHLAVVSFESDSDGRAALLVGGEYSGGAVMLSQLGDRVLDVYDRLLAVKGPDLEPPLFKTDAASTVRELIDSHHGLGASEQITAQAAPLRAAALLAAYFVIAAFTLAQPVLSGSLLGFAADQGHMSSAKLLLAIGSPADRIGYGVSRRSDRTTPLYLAARAGHLPMVELLLAHGADYSKRCRNAGFTALHVAGEYGHLHIVRRLLDGGADPNVLNNWQQTPLSQVSWQNRPTDIDVARLLIEKGAIVDAADKDGWTPLHTAVRSVNLPMIGYLVGAGADVNRQTRRGSSAIGLALAKGRAKALQELVAAGVDVNKQFDDGATLLTHAVNEGSEEQVAALLEAGAQADVAALHLAVQRRHPAVVRALLTAGARSDVAVGGYTALQRAAWQGDTEMVTAMLDSGIEPDLSSSHPPSIVLAAERGHLKIVELLVERGADVNVNFEGWTAMRAATMRRHQDVVEYLSANGASR